MSGSIGVNAKLTVVERLLLKECEAAMDSHIKESANYIKSDHAWTDRTSAASGGVEGHTDVTPAQIKSSVCGHAPQNEWLDQAGFFNGRYKIFERARSNNIARLWAKLALIMKGVGGIRL